MRRFQGVVWAVVVIGLVGCGAPVKSSDPLTLAELEKMAPDLVSTVDDAETRRRDAELTQLSMGFQVDLEALRKARPGNPRRAKLEAEVTRFLDQAEELIQPEWKQTRHYNYAGYWKTAAVLADVNSATYQAKERIRANELSLELCRRKLRASSGNTELRELLRVFAFSGQKVLDSIPNTARREEELRIYLDSLPQAGDFRNAHRQSAAVTWHAWDSGVFIEPGAAPFQDYRLLPGALDDHLNLRATAKLFIEAHRKDIRAAEEGRTFTVESVQKLIGVAPEERLLSDELDPIRPATAEKLKAWAQKMPGNSTGEFFFRENFAPMSGAVLRAEAQLAILRGALATMISLDRGDMPESWEDLVADGLLEAVPLDPWTRQPLSADFPAGKIWCPSVPIDRNRPLDSLENGLVQISGFRRRNR